MLKTLQYVVTGIVIALAALLIFSKFPIPGNYRLYVVQSGSMEPEIAVGSVVAVKAARNYQISDVITFRDGEQTVTHRIVGEENGRLVTKGDANEEADTKAVRRRDILGKVFLNVPYLGYAVNSVRTPYGFFLLIVLPATWIIYDEIRKIKNEVMAMRQKKLAVAVVAITSSAMLLNATSAFFSDVELSSGNSFTAGVWDQTNTNHLVINEVYYDVDSLSKGSETDNEWVELYNPTETAVDISSWIIADADVGDVIPADTPAIPAHGFALITNKSNTWTFWPSIPQGTILIVLDSPIGSGLNNGADRVVLEDSTGAEIDAVSWEGDNYAFSPDLPNITDGHSYERDPDGVDTNTKDDFINRGDPTPGE